MRQKFDATRGGQAVPIYMTGGVVSGSNTGGVITLITADGRTFTCKRLEDGSYEGDALKAVGLPMVTGREAAGTGSEALNGWRGGTATGGGSPGGQFNAGGGTRYDVDPFLTPGDPTSGFVSGVEGFMPTTTTGAADNRTQSYNYRVTMTNSPARRYWSIVFAGGPPSGYSAARYELLGRYLAKLTSLSVTVSLNTIIIINTLARNMFDMNSRSGFSLDYNNSGNVFVATEMDYSVRKAAIRDLRSYTYGLFYWILYSGDSRIPAGLINDLNGYGLAEDHYLDPGPNNEMFKNGKVYIRAFRRQAAGIGGARFDANDANATDGATPRISTNTVSNMCYPNDSHNITRFAYQASGNGTGPWTAWVEGSLAAPAGGTNTFTPIPFEICMPDKAVMPNVCASFCLACTHTAMSALRMEGPSAQTGASLGMAMAISLELGVPLQDVPYATLRAAMLAEPEATPAVLPQTT